MAGNLSVCLLSFACMIGAIVFFTQVEEGGIYEAAGQAIPKWAFLVVIVVSGIMFLVSFVGGCGAKMRSRKSLILFAILASLTILVQTVGTVFLVLYANDQPTVASLDDSVEDAQALLEISLVEYALGPSDKGWVSSQDLFQCCGVDAEANYLFPEYQLNSTEFLQKLLTGEARQCAEKVPVIDAFIQANPVYSEQVDADLVALVGVDFFCKDKIRQFSVEATIYVSATSGFLIFMQLISLVCAIKLLCAGMGENAVEDSYVATASRLGMGGSGTATTFSKPESVVEPQAPQRSAPLQVVSDMRDSTYSVEV